MKRYILPLVLIPIARAQLPCPPTPAWALCEITVPGTAPTQAEFRSPSHKTLLIHSFTQGQNQILRIVPTEAGTWDYRLNNQEFSFTATPSDAPGYIEPANVHHFRYIVSKQPHLWAGGINHVRIVADPANDEQIVAIHKAGKTADLVVPANANMTELMARFGALNVIWPSKYRSYQSVNGDAVAIEHQAYPAPQVNDFGVGITDTDQFRHALWRTTLDGAYPESQPPNDTAATQLKHWFTFFSGTRHWELEPFFDAGGRHALALEGVEYIVYVETPGPVTVEVEKHSYDVAWFNPITGQSIDAKNLKTETFAGDPPDNSHDWVLHISRESHKAGMLKSYRFESREILQQEVEVVKVPYEVVQPAGDMISLNNPGNFAVKLTKETKASKAMRYLWTGEVTADGQPAAILGTGPEGKLVIPPNIATRFPASLHLRVEGLNGVGKLYSVDKNYQLVP